MIKFKILNSLQIKLSLIFLRYKISLLSQHLKQLLIHKIDGLDFNLSQILNFQNILRIMF